jgi:hypothetical protein
MPKIWNVGGVIIFIVMKNSITWLLRKSSHLKKNMKAKFWLPRCLRVKLMC